MYKVKLRFLLNPINHDYQFVTFFQICKMYMYVLMHKPPYTPPPKSNCIVYILFCNLFYSFLDIL